MVKRFRPYCWDSPVTPTVRENSGGDYVLYEDYDVLAQAAEQLVKVLTMEEYEPFPALEAVQRALGRFHVTVEHSAPKIQEKHSAHPPPIVHSTECRFQHWLNDSESLGFNWTIHALRKAFYAGRGQEVPAEVDEACAARDRKEE